MRLHRNNELASSFRTLELLKRDAICVSLTQITSPLYPCELQGVLRQYPLDDDDDGCLGHFIDPQSHWVPGFYLLSYSHSHIILAVGFVRVTYNVSILRFEAFLLFPPEPKRFLSGIRMEGNANKLAPPSQTITNRMDNAADAKKGWKLKACNRALQL